jgi:hypothetical protein
LYFGDRVAVLNDFIYQPEGVYVVLYELMKRCIIKYVHFRDTTNDLPSPLLVDNHFIVWARPFATYPPHMSHHHPLGHQFMSSTDFL